MNSYFHGMKAFIQGVNQHVWVKVIVPIGMIDKVLSELSSLVEPVAFVDDLLICNEGNRRLRSNRGILTKYASLMSGLL